MTDLVQRAKEFATSAHQRIDHRRKYSGQPYEVHLKSVATLVAEVTDDPEMIAAAWLHDTVEDTAATHHDIEDHFGPAVARLVHELTDVSRPGDGNRALRKAMDREHLAQASDRAQTIKLADLIDNARDICRHDPRFARIYLGEMAALLEVLDRGHPELMRRARKLLRECEEKLGITPLHLEPDPVASHREALGFTRRRIERLFNEAFVARDLAEPLLSFDADTDAKRILETLEQTDSRVAGIRRGGLTVAYLRRTDLETGLSVAEARPFRQDQVLAGDAGLPEVVEVLTRHRYCFITTLGTVNGVIGRADMESPLVRMWLFGMITMLEMRLGELIEQRWPDDAWTGLVSPGRLEKARALQAERQRRGQHASLLDCLQFSDKGHLVIRDPEYFRRLGLRSKSEARDSIRALESLRNNLAHSQPITVHDWPQIVRLTRLVAGTEG
ncbi:MAG TPA: HD domain-containing protein [Thiotrichales bacterium]|nr:HD domain-containing protein [Thiotrichales bacterium]